MDGRATLVHVLSNPARRYYDITSRCIYYRIYIHTCTKGSIDQAFFSLFVQYDEKRKGKSTNSKDDFDSTSKSDSSIRKTSYVLIHPFILRYVPYFLFLLFLFFFSFFFLLFIPQSQQDRLKNMSVLERIEKERKKKKEIDFLSCLQKKKRKIKSIIILTYR